MSGTGHAAAMERLLQVARTGRALGARSDNWQERRDEAIAAALDENVPIKQIARALGVSRQRATELVRRVQRGN